MCTDTATDRVSVTNTSLLITDTSVLTVNGFTVANDAIRVIDTGVAAGASISNASYAAVSAGSNTTGPTVVKGVIEIENSNLATLTDLADGGVVELAIIGALGTTTTGTYTVVLYSGANAGVYDMLVGTNAMTAASDITIELVAVLNGVGANALTAANFY